VSPATFRHPSVLAKMVATADEISGGRVELGIGAGWHEPEHRAFGFPFPAAAVRLEMLEEQLKIVRRSWEPGPFDFEGRHYRVAGLDARPTPVQQPHPNVIVGGGGGRRSVALAARWADEYNTVFASPKVCRERRDAVEAAWSECGREPSSVVFSLMTGGVVGDGAADVERVLHRAMEGRGAGGSLADWLPTVRDEWIIGTVDEAVARLREYESAGVDRVMLQHQSHDDVEMVGVLGEVAARLRASADSPG